MKIRMIKFGILCFMNALMGAFMLGCASTGLLSHTGGGLFYQDSVEAVTATASPDAMKEGRACNRNYFGMYSGGDASIDIAKKNGGITTVSSVDVEYYRIFIFYGSACTIVRGK